MAFSVYVRIRDSGPTHSFLQMHVATHMNTQAQATLIYATANTTSHTPRAYIQTCTYMISSFFQIL